MKFFNFFNASLVLLFIVSFVSAFLFFSKEKHIPTYNSPSFVEKIASLVTPAPLLPSLPESFEIPQRYHTFQTFNNCGPATLSMALSYWGIDKSQQELGNILRPYQVAGGDNDDKSVTLQEVARQAEEYGLHAYLRPNGTTDKLEKFISQGVPVVTRTWLKPNEDIGHYRIVRGYDKNALELIQDDSLHGKNLRYSYEDFNSIWKQFNYEYLILVDDDKKVIAEQILGEELEENTAWENALARINEELMNDAKNVHLIFARSRIYYYLKEYDKSINDFEKVEASLSFRTLWYQIEPILSYYELGEYDRVFQLTDQILNNQNRAFSELYQLRGEIYLKQGNMEAARNEFETAIFYKKNFQPAINSLNSI